MCKDDWRAGLVTLGAIVLFASVARVSLWVWNHAIFG